MEWDKLLSLQRFGDTIKRDRKAQNEIRLGFEVDYDRIVFSNAFRSLQDKTQVIPFSKTDFVHTRLTHSLEVSVVARSLGRLAGKGVLNKHNYLHDELGFQIQDFGAITAAAALAHDIGNPPFGHSGEHAIGHFFKNGKGAGLKKYLNAAEFQDLCDFEGNANGFKILTESFPGMPGGLRLSYATLGAFTKYPKGSLPRKPSRHVADKKYGFFQAQKPDFESVAAALNLNGENRFLRHPLAYLVEAADDICYTIIDFEDGINLGWISEDYALEYLINLVRNAIDTRKYAALKHKPQRLSYLRALAINRLIEDAISVFMEYENQILAGSFPKSLLDQSQYKAQIKDIISASVKNIYESEEVVQKEIIGHSAITTLLEAFIFAGVRALEGTLTSYDKLILALVPEGVNFFDKTHYGTLLNATCFVASLSDGKALSLAKKIGL